MGKHTNRNNKADELTDAEYAELKALHKELQDALKGPRGAEVEQAIKDFVEFPPKSGDLES